MDKDFQKQDGLQKYNSIVLTFMRRNNLMQKCFFLIIFSFKYVYAFYWGVTTMTTVGLGDLIPANIYEAVVLSCFMFVSCGTFAYMFNSIGVVLGELN